MVSPSSHSVSTSSPMFSFLCTGCGVLIGITFWRCSWSLWSFQLCKVVWNATGHNMIEWMSHSTYFWTGRHAFGFVYMCQVHTDDMSVGHSEMSLPQHRWSISVDPRQSQYPISVNYILMQSALQEEHRDTKNGWIRPLIKEYLEVFFKACVTSVHAMLWARLHLLVHMGVVFHCKVPRAVRSVL